jgi:formylmethanofuran dehydrogenase subunit C
MERPRLLPTFLYNCTCQPVFLRLLWKQLQDLGAPVPEFVWRGMVRRYTGDTSELGKGEILVFDPESNKA